MATTIERASEQLADVASSLGRVSGDVRIAKQLLALLGWDLPPGVKDIGLAQLDFTTVAARLDDLITVRSREDASDLELAAAFGEVVGALAETFAHIEDIARLLQASPEYLAATDIVDQFFPRLADVLVIEAIRSAIPEAVPLGTLLGLFEFPQMPADPAIFQVEHLRSVVRWDRFAPLLTDPSDVLHDVYGWGTADFNAAALVTNIGRVLECFATDVFIGALPRSVEEQIVGHPVPESDATPGVQLFVSLDKGLGFDAFDVGVMVFAVRASTPGGADGGIGLSPYALGTTVASFPLSDTLSLVLSSVADLQGGLALILRAGRDPELLPGLFEAPGEGTPPTSFDLVLRNAAATGERFALFSAPGLSIDAAAVTAGFRITAGASPNPTLSAGIEDGRVQVVPDRADGFLASILPAEGITTTLNLTASWSQRDGVRIHGGAGLRTSIVLHQQLGPLRLDTLDLALTAGSDALELAVTATGAAVLGPLTARVDSIGVVVALRFQRGNLGNANLAVHSKPPSGVGLAIDAAGVTGGGFLFFDKQSGLYAGAVQLNLEGGLALRALGMIATRLPDGSKGFSLLVVITAEDFKPYPLGLGFMLTRIGGLLAINRTFNEQVLREGIKNHTLDNILFPANPTRDALQLLSNLSKVFPMARGHHLLGPMAEIEWGTPTLLTMQLGIVLEIGARLRLLVMGQVEAILPKKENDLLRIKMDAVGILDFDQGTASLDAVLYESRLLKKFVLTGAMALRLKWKGAPNFALAIGGLHHAFNPPANFPQLDRIAINLSAGDNPRIICEAYFAVTSNTVQFGARANLHAAAHGFSIEGDIGFDVLIQLNPFHFLAEFHASVQLKRDSRNLFMVAVQGALEGPRPLRARGKATFEVLWWDISVSFDKTLVEGDRPPLPPAINVLNELAQALADPRNWQEVLPTGERRIVIVRELQTPSEVRIHPLGNFGVKQTVVPLNLTRDIDKFGSTTPSGPRRFGITSITVGGATQKSTPQTDFFAPAQFFEMTDDEKIASPSFDTMEAGITVGADNFTFSNADGLSVVLNYETILVDTQTSAPGTRKEDYTLKPDRLFEHARFGAAGRCDVRRSGLAKFQNRQRTPAVTVTKPGFVIASTEDLSPQAVPGAEAGKPMNFIDAQQALRNLSRQNPVEAKKRQVVRAYELIRS
jgi:hypothetical protein